MRALAASRTRFPLARLATRTLGRAHVVLGRRPAFRAELESLRTASAVALASALGGEVAVGARMADTPVPAGRALGHAALFCIVSLGGPGAEAVLELDPRLGAALAAQRTGRTGPDTTVLSLTRFEHALLGELTLRVLAGCLDVPTAEGRWRPRLVEVGVPRAEAERRLGSGRVVVVELALDTGAARGRPVLLLPELAVMAAALGHPEQRASPGTGPGRSRVRFSPRFVCGCLWPHELPSLERGAAVALPGGRVSDGALHAPILLVRPAVALAGELSSRGVRFTGAQTCARSQEVTQVDPALSEMPVELEVELASLSLSLAELGGLQPGAVLPLRVSPGDPVFLRAGDRRFARAELVEIEGEVAARVLELLP